MAEAKPPIPPSAEPEAPRPELASVSTDENRALELKGLSLPEFGPWFKNLRGFLIDVQAEFKKVTWPTRKEIAVETGIVILVCSFLTFLVVFYDWIFNAVANRAFYGQ